MRAGTIIASLGIHAAVALAALGMGTARTAPRNAVRIMRADVRKPVPDPRPPPPQKTPPKPLEPNGPPRTPKPPLPRSKPKKAPRAEALKAHEPSPRQPAPPKSEKPAAFDTGLLLGNAAGPGLSVGSAATPAPETPRAIEQRLKPKKPAIDACDEPPSKPSPIDRPVEIEYTARSKAEGVEGRLILGLRVGTDGAVIGVEVVHGVDPSLDASAVAAVKTWRFAPARRCGKSVESTYTLARRFELGD